MDRFNRKRLMLLGDAIAALSTLAIGSLYLSDQLQLWHLYVAAMLNGGFGQMQLLAYKASISSLLPAAQLTRANSLNAVDHYGSVIMGPALAGALYPLIGLPGILVIDLAIFAVAVSTLILGAIPQPVVVKPLTPEPLLSLNGGPKRKVQGMLTGFIGAGLCKTEFSLGRSTTVWVPTQFWLLPQFSAAEQL